MSDPLKVLILEDQMLVAFALKDMLIKMGLEPVGPFANTHDALAVLDSVDINFALLDINLGGNKTSVPFADALIARGTPFAFVTGYGSANGLPARFGSIGCFTKPIRKEDVTRAMAQG